MSERFYAIAQKVKECLCESFADELCYCGLMLGDDTSPLGIINCGGDAKCGIAWVRPVEIFPSANFPLADLEGETLRPGPLAMQFQVGIARCYPRPERGHQYPDPDKIDKAFARYMADMETARRAIMCCLNSRDPLWRDLTSRLGSWTPLPAESGASGGVWNAWVQ